MKERRSYTSDSTRTKSTPLEPFAKLSDMQCIHKLAITELFSLQQTFPNNTQRLQLFLCSGRCGPMDKAPDYGSGDPKFDSWQSRIGRLFLI